MPSISELAPIAASTAFIFTGAILRPEATPADTEHTAVIVAVRDVIKLPSGMRGFAGREVTVHLRHPLSEGHYVFFADPVSVGSTRTATRFGPSALFCATLSDGALGQRGNPSKNLPKSARKPPGASGLGLGLARRHGGATAAVTKA